VVLNGKHTAANQSIIQIFWRTTVGTAFELLWSLLGL
jgi:hypothetical protein